MFVVEAPPPKKEVLPRTGPQLPQTPAVSVPLPASAASETDWVMTGSEKGEEVSRQKAEERANLRTIQAEKDELIENMRALELQEMEVKGKIEGTSVYEQLQERRQASEKKSGGATSSLSGGASAEEGVAALWSNMAKKGNRTALIAREPPPREQGP